MSSNFAFTGVYSFNNSPNIALWSAGSGGIWQELSRLGSAVIHSLREMFKHLSLTGFAGCN